MDELVVCSTEMLIMLVDMLLAITVKRVVCNCRFTKAVLVLYAWERKLFENLLNMLNGKIKGN